MAGSRRPAVAAVIVATLAALPACGLLLDLDHGTPDGDDASFEAGFDAPASVADAGVEAADAAPDAGSDAGAIADAPVEAAALEASPPVDAGPDAPDACTPDPSWCDTHCGTSVDNCSESRTCPSDCGQNSTCGSGSTCVCQSDPTWCHGRCGSTTDNCNQPIDCGTCVVDAGCMDDGQACNGKQCGTATNNCGQTVTCGLVGLCPNPVSQLCQSDGTCCTPNSGAACGDQCGTTATDGCGRPVQCPSSCGGSRVCFQQACCTPASPCNGACGVTMTDNCGESVQCGCSSSEECAPAGTCCMPHGCSASCVDNCGLPSTACCVDAGPDAGPEAGAPEAGPAEAGPDDADTGDASSGDDAASPLEGGGDPADE
jgi:hypothetical protein